MSQNYYVQKDLSLSVLKEWKGMRENHMAVLSKTED